MATARKARRVIMPGTSGPRAPSKKAAAVEGPPDRSGADPFASQPYGASAGLRCSSTSELIDELREGLPVAAFETLRRQMGIPVKALAKVTHIAQRTLNRRRQSGRLQTDESERLFRIAALFDRATQVLGTKDRARSWFSGPKPALGGRSPLEFADTEPGAREVEALLGRLEHGVFS